MLFTAKALTLLLQCRVHSSFRGFWNSQHSDVTFRCEASGIIILKKSLLTAVSEQNAYCFREAECKSSQTSKNVWEKCRKKYPTYMHCQDSSKAEYDTEFEYSSQR